MLRESFTLFWICFVLWATLIQPFDRADLEYVRHVHRTFCGADPACTLQPEVSQWTENQSTSATTGSLDELPFPVPPYFDHKCCEPCSCNRSTCGHFGSCCPDVLDHLPTVEEAMLPTIAACQTMSLRGIGYLQAFWVYRLCPKEFLVGDNQTAAEIKSKCENREDYFHIDTRLPVIDSSTRRIYANGFCAMCGLAQESDLIPLIPRLSCYNGDYFLQSVNTETLIRDVLDTDSCDLEFDWPMDHVDFSPPYCLQMESRCNVTGLWRNYDPLIEAACHSYLAPYNCSYNNIFCLMCNQAEIADTCIDPLEPNLGGSRVGSISFAVVMDFSRVMSRDEDDDTEPMRCAESQVYDHYMDVCRDITCTFPRMLHAGRCINIGDTVSQVAYKLHLKLQPSKGIDPSMLDMIVPVIKDYTEQMLLSWKCMDTVFNYKLFYKVGMEIVNENEAIDASYTTSNGERLDDITGLSDGDSSSELLVDTNVSTTTTTSSSESITTDTTIGDTHDSIDDHDNDRALSQPDEDAQNNMTNNLSESQGRQSRQEWTTTYVLWEVGWNIISDDNITHSVDFLRKVLELDGTNITLKDTLDTGLSITVFLSITDLDTGRFGYPIDPEQNTILSEYPVYINLPNADLLSNVTVPIQSVKRTLVCPLVKLDSDELTFTEGQDGLFVEELGATFNRTTYERRHDGNNRITYYICTDAYTSIIDEFVRAKAIDNPVTPQGILSIVCSCMSIMGALLTLITYLLFRELRTQPGINNMFLCLYLICAQTFFTFATHPKDDITNWACSLLGGLNHFFWLMVIFAMNVCCYHMFMVFIGQSSNHSVTGPRLAKSVKYTVYCVCSSLLFVVTNIVVVVVDTNMESIGYGDGMCYISRPEMIGYTFALPLGVVTLINLVFFVTVVVKISRSPNVDRKTQASRNYFKIYAKLSTVTGITWFFGFLFVFTGHVAFEYVFILLKGGIGVLIFLSFVCNRRVYRLFREKVGKPKRRTPSYGMNYPKTTRTDLNTRSRSMDSTWVY